MASEGDRTELTQPAPRGTDEVTVLTDGEIEVLGRMPWSSNATYLVTVHHGDIEARAIYKPGRGERPLWDFPSGLYRREVAAYELSEAMGIHLVPTTVLRDGPFGEGSVQWFIPADFREHYFSMHETRPDLHDQFRAMAVFDVIANNTDRKSGHCLLDPDGRIWGIDNGLCFSADFKLRTVIWEFGGEPIPDTLLTAVEPLIESVPLRVSTLLDDDEVAAIIERARDLLDDGVLPEDPSGRRYPWPLV
jgi:uncharacterized repeat protein (TIGR03843 family)